MTAKTMSFCASARPASGFGGEEDDLPNRPTDRGTLLVALAFAGCASREVPASFPPSSPASDKAGEAPPAVVTASLDAERDEADPHAKHGATNKADAGHHGGHHGH